MIPTPAPLPRALAWAHRLVLGLWFGSVAVGAGQVVINEVQYHPSGNRPLEFIELHNPGTGTVSLAGWRLDQFRFPTNASLVATGYVVVARDPAAFAREFHFKPFGPLPGKLSHHGETITLQDAQGKTVDALRYGVGFPWPTAAGGGGPSLERVNPSLPSQAPSSWRSSGFPVAGPPGKHAPTPGAQNCVDATNCPPDIREVAHTPLQPKTGEPVVVTARVGTPNGLRSVTLRVQVVAPGQYVRKSDAAYEQGWRELPMHDDGHDGDARAGDGVFTAVVPGEVQQHRRLVRYRVAVTDRTGLSVSVPYADDECPNFAWFVSDGIPAWTGASQSGKTPPLVFPADFLTTLPTYRLLARAEDVERSQWDGGANKQRFAGTLVYDGRVYDHIQFHNRGQASTYVSGKNKWGFRFNRAHEFQSRDLWGRLHRYPWNSLSMNACASPWAPINRGMAGMDEAVAFRAYQLAGVPSPNTHWINFRVIDRPDEAPARSQYEGDEWGLYLVVQDTDGAWLRELGLPEGSTFNPETGRGHVAAGMPADHSDWSRFADGSRGGQSESWWRANLNLPAYYSFHALNRLLANIDIRPGANHCFYHAPDGHWSPVPWDLDMMFIPRTHQPGYINQIHCLDVPALKIEYQNRAREILDLFCSDTTTNGGQIGQLVAELGAKLCPPGQPRTWPELDMAKWNWHPRTQDKGSFYANPAEDWRMGGSWRRTLATPDFAGLCKYIAEFCSDSRPTKNYAPNDGDQRGYGFGYLAYEAKDDTIPERPNLRYMGANSYPAKKLIFQVSPFASPQGTNAFAAVQWRLGEIGAPGLAGDARGTPCRYELEPRWQSEKLVRPTSEIHLPVDACSPGRTYRVRARYQDRTGRWGHWSEAIQFVAGK